MGSLFDDMMEDHARAMRGSKKKRFRVFIDQVNQTFVDVEAKDEEEAREKGYNLWLDEHVHSTVSAVQSI